jgi:urease accessory protein
MPLAKQILRAGASHPAPVADTLILDFAQRTAKQGFVFTGKGTCIEFAFEESPSLATDDALLLDDGKLVEIVAAPEPVVEARIPDPAALARVAWLLGNRHAPVQLFANRLRIRPNAEIEILLKERGLKTAVIEAPFEPDAAAASHDHHHDHDHHHHGHHHDHGHAHGHDHGHDHHHDHGHHHDHAREHHHAHHHADGHHDDRDHDHHQDDRK